jgi:hypothetical protein
MSGKPDGLEWLLLRVALGVVALVVVADVVVWKLHDRANPQPTRLERSVFCLKDNKGVVAVVPAGDPLADSAGEGALTTTVEGNDVTVALASSDEQAITIERSYRAVADDLGGRLERRGRTVYLWRFESSPTQRQTMYDCQY